MTIIERLRLPWTPSDRLSDEIDDLDQEWLRSKQRPEGTVGHEIGIVDLFSGCGGMTLGFSEASRRLGMTARVKAVADNDRRTTGVLTRNLGGRAITVDLGRLFGSPSGTPVTGREAVVASILGDVDVLLGGPPCQGHSDLNNHTRRNDPKNRLYLAMARAAEVLRPRLVVIENVPPVQWDSGKVVEATEAALRELGYKTSGRVINCLRLGVPQTRKRFVLLGARDLAIEPDEVMASLLSRSFPPRTVRWAIEDLEDGARLDGAELDRISRISEENAKRIAFLDESGETNLPNDRRPKCHRDEPTHSYKSMYGRLSWNLPAQTITTGFTSMGQGRFVHPSKRRTLTPHEAARLQTFPDWFDWGGATRGELATMIGNAVPPLMAMEIGLATLSAMRPPDMS
ncbi:MAG TPA: DNA cytosine methyltransferase [Acidimicrobiales bacterium]|nr:DNA cytosine methyltransferase [Acidimicrobiales bacterium]